MFKITNLDQFEREVEAWLTSVEQEVISIAQALSYEALFHLAYHSPQYSGDFVANWRMSVNTPDRRFTEGIFPERGFPSKHPFIKGDSPAIEYAMTENVGKADGLALGGTVWISNSAVHHDLYAWKIENNRIKFRSGNSGAPVQHTMDYLSKRYKVINRANVQGLRGAGL